ncbi:hypothetical protein QL285_076598 [Trifolium repens]|nr:hypothetical protein QL285_076598 [Trifolium repens]
MSSSSVANVVPYEIPTCGCNKPMKLFISNSNDNPKRRFWKCSRLRVPNCDLFTWDDEIEGHPPYVRSTASEPRNRLRNSNDKATSSGQISCECNCQELVKDITAMITVVEGKKMEKTKMKLYSERKISKFYKTLLFVSWIMFVACFKFFA